MEYEVPAIRLTDKMKLWAEEYMVDRNPTRAAVAAGYSERTAGAMGSKLLYQVRKGKNPMLAKYLEQLQAQQDEERILRKKFLREQLHRMVSRDVVGFERNRVVVSALEDVPRPLRLCVDSFKVKQYMDPETGAVASQVIEVKLSPLAASMDMALKVQGMYVKDNEQKPGGQVTVVNWQDMFKPPPDEPDPLEVIIDQVESEPASG
jgi:phage terminase small subunit